MKSKRETVEEALRACVRLINQWSVTELRDIGCVGDLDAMCLFEHLGLRILSG